MTNIVTNADGSVAITITAHKVIGFEISNPVLLLAIGIVIAAVLIFVVSTARKRKSN